MDGALFMYQRVPLPAGPPEYASDLFLACTNKHISKIRLDSTPGSSAARSTPRNISGRHNRQAQNLDEVSGGSLSDLDNDDHAQSHAQFEEWVGNIDPHEVPARLGQQRFSGQQRSNCKPKDLYAHFERGTALVDEMDEPTRIQDASASQLPMSF